MNQLKNLLIADVSQVIPYTQVITYTKQNNDIRKMPKINKT